MPRRVRCSVRSRASELPAGVRSPAAPRFLLRRGRWAWPVRSPGGTVRVFQVGFWRAVMQQKLLTVCAGFALACLAAGGTRIGVQGPVTMGGETVGVIDFVKV